MERHYEYYAIVDDNHTLDNPFVVVRTLRGGEGEEFFSTKLEWVRSDLLYRIQSGRDYNEAAPISEEAGKRFEETQARRVEEARKKQTP